MKSPNALFFHKKNKCDDILRSIIKKVNYFMGQFITLSLQFIVASTLLDKNMAKNRHTCAYTLINSLKKVTEIPPHLLFSSCLLSSVWWCDAHNHVTDKTTLKQTSEQRHTRNSHSSDRSSLLQVLAAAPAGNHRSKQTDFRAYRDFNKNPKWATLLWRKKVDGGENIQLTVKSSSRAVEIWPADPVSFVPRSTLFWQISVTTTAVAVDQTERTDLTFKSRRGE